MPSSTAVVHEMKLPSNPTIDDCLLCDRFIVEGRNALEMRLIRQPLPQLLLRLPYVPFEDVPAALLVFTNRKAVLAGRLFRGLSVLSYIAAAASPIPRLARRLHEAVVVHIRLRPPRPPAAHFAAAPPR